ncbi:MAG: hypothetical protein ABIA04_13455 [Pseudomonadota bacterium]
MKIIITRILLFLSLAFSFIPFLALSMEKPTFPEECTDFSGIYEMTEDCEFVGDKGKPWPKVWIIIQDGCNSVSWIYAGLDEGTVTGGGTIGFPFVGIAPLIGIIYPALKVKSNSKWLDANATEIAYSMAFSKNIPIDGFDFDKYTMVGKWSMENGLFVNTMVELTEDKVDLLELEGKESITCKYAPANISNDLIKLVGKN